MTSRENDLYARLSITVATTVCVFYQTKLLCLSQTYEVRIRAKGGHQAGAYRSFYGMTPWAVLLPTGWDVSPLQGYPHPSSIKFTGSHLYTWVERGTVRVKFLDQEHNTMSKQGFE